MFSLAVKHALKSPIVHCQAICLIVYREIQSVKVTYHVMSLGRGAKVRAKGVRCEFGLVIFIYKLNTFHPGIGSSGTFNQGLGWHSHLHRRHPLHHRDGGHGGEGPAP